MYACEVRVLLMLQIGARAGPYRDVTRESRRTGGGKIQEPGMTRVITTER